LALCCKKNNMNDGTSLSLTEDKLDDHILMEATSEGKEEAFSLLVGRHLRSMTSVAQRMLGNAAEADEVAQEVFLRLWQQAPHWDPEGEASVKTWLSRVTTNLCLDMLRRRRHVSLEDIDEPEDPAKGPLDALRKDSQRQLVQQCLLFLPDRQRAAIILSYFEDMRDQEIADVMGVSVGAVESLLVRGRKALRDHMQHLGLRWGEDF